MTLRKSILPSMLGSLFAAGLGASRPRERDDDPYAGVTKHTFHDRLDSLTTDEGFIERSVRKPSALGAPYGVVGFGGRPEHPSKRRAPDIDPTSGRQKVSLKTMSNRQRAMYEAALRRRARQLGQD